MGAGVSAGTAAMIAGGVGAAGSLGGALISSSGQQQAAGTNAAAQAWEEAAVEPQMLGAQINQGQLFGLMNLPGGAADPGQGPLGQAPSLTGADISQMPGYKFTLKQGELATQNAAAAQGLGVSGNALAAAGQYATGLASQNYQQYFNDFWANQQNRYNMLMGTAQLGTNAAVGQGSNIASTAANTASAQAASANALGSGLSGAGSSAANATLLSALLGNQTGSTVNAANTAATNNALMSETVAGQVQY